MHAFASFMRDGADDAVRRALETAVRRWAPAASVVEVRAGDAVLIAADDPVALAQTARHLMDDVYQAPGQPRLRVALHHGEVRTRPRGNDGEIEIVGGDAVLCAARVEPIVEPGQIWATDSFQAQFVERPSLWRTVPLTASEGEERYNVRKAGAAEPDCWLRLFRLES